MSPNGFDFRLAPSTKPTGQSRVPRSSPLEINNCNYGYLQMETTQQPVVRPGTDVSKESKSSRARLIRQRAYACFARTGYHGTAVDHICAEAKISKGAFYWHFASKQEVFLSILDAWAEETERELRKQFAVALASEDRYAAITAALLKEARRGRAIMPVWLEYVAQGTHDPEIQKGIAAFHRRVRTVIGELLTPFLSKHFDADTIAVLSGTILAGFVGLISQDLADPQGADFDSHTEHFMKLVSLFVEHSSVVAKAFRKPA